MIDAYAVADVRAAEERAMRELPDGELMRRAAQGLAAVVSARLASNGSRVVALVGSGNNGGDALYAVASLALAGVPVAVVTVGEKVHPGGASAARAAGIEIADFVVGPAPEPGSADSGGPEHDAGQGFSRARALLAEADVVVDGLLGIGGRPGLSPGLGMLAALIPDDAYVLAVDLPSGADPSGEAAPGALGSVFADETVTFGVPKPVHLLPATEATVGRLTVVDIGLEVTAAPAVQRLIHDDVADLWPVPGPADDKYSRGVLGVVAGGEHYTGAPLLAVASAVCAGAGMVRYVGPPTPTALIRAQVPEAVFGFGRVQAWLVGPGLDPDDESEPGRAQRVAAQDALASGLPCVIDAGGLDLLQPGSLPRTSPTLLTPHAGELARLLVRLSEHRPGHPDFVQPVGRSQVQGEPLGPARRVAELTGATVLLKGSTTLVVPPSAAGLPVRSQADGPAWLGTAGTGDVLAGLAGMLLAAGLSPLDAGSLAALVHGLAGEAANPGGPVRALGVAHAIPGVVARLLARPFGRRASPRDRAR